MEENDFNSNETASNQEKLNTGHSNAEVMKEIGMSLYSFERDRKRDLESRAGILVAILGVVIGLILTNLKLDLFLKAQEKWEIVLLCIVYIIKFLALVFIIISFYFLLRVLKTSGYNTIGPSLLIKKEYLNDNPEEFIFDIADTLKNTVEKNKACNNLKAKCFESAILFLSLSIYFYIPSFLVYSLLSQVIK